MLLTEQRELLDGFRRGDRVALEAVYKTYAPAVVAFLRSGFSFSSGGRQCRFRGTQSQFDLEDRLQDTFSRAFAEPARLAYDGLSPFKSYLFTIAKNLVIDDFRRKERALTEFSIEEPIDEALERGGASDPIEGHVEPSGQPARDQEAAELTRLVSEFKSGLLGREKTIYELRFEAQLEHAEIVSKTGWSASKVKTSEKRIRKSFFEFMRGRGYFTGYEQKPSGWLRLVRGSG